MIYPFRFKIGDRVEVSETVKHKAGLRGEVTALELSRNKTVAVVRPYDREVAIFRVHESQLTAA